MKSNLQNTFLQSFKFKSRFLSYVYGNKNSQLKKLSWIILEKQIDYMWVVKFSINAMTIFWITIKFNIPIESTITF